MRKMIWLLIILAALWGAWWMLATTQMQNVMARAFDDRRAAGWEVTVKDISKAGFPLLLQNRLSGLSLADPKQDFAVEAPQLDLSAPVWWPGDLAVQAPVARVELRAGALPLELNLRDMRADLSLHPGLALQLEGMQIRSAQMQVDGPDGMLLEAEEPRAVVQQSSDVATDYGIALLPGSITPGPLLRKVLGDAAGPPILSARMAVSFAEPFDRHTVMQRTIPEVRALSIENIDATLGDVALAAEGALSFDAEGRPDGTLSLRITNWSQLLDAVERAALLPSSMRAQVDTVLRVLESRSGTAGALDLDLVFNQGEMALAGIPLGPAPRLMQP